MGEMRVEKTDFVDGAKVARGIVVIIDVFRAFSTACYGFARGVEKIYPVGDVADALALGREKAGAILVGERHGRKLEGFDYGNSPTELYDVELCGKPIILTTHSGTQGLVNALQAEELLTGAFVNAKATCDYIRRKSPDLVTLVRMGLKAETASDEDNLCADYLESLLLGGEFNVSSIEATLRKSPFAERFFDPAKPWNPPRDFELCLKIDIFDFFIKAQRDEEGRLYLAHHGQT